MNPSTQIPDQLTNAMSPMSPDDTAAAEYRGIGGWHSFFIIAAFVIAAMAMMTLAATRSYAQSLDCFDETTSVHGADVSSLLREGPSLIVFWSTKCAPCLKALPPMNTYAGRMPGLNFIWVSAESDDRLERLADSLTNIHFVVDGDSASWREFRPSLWGVGFAFDRDGEQLWHGYESELTESMLARLMESKKPEKKINRFGVEYRVTNEVDYSASEISVGTSEDSEEWELKNKPFTSILGSLIQGAYGGKTEIVYLNADHVSDVVMMKLHIRYGTLTRQQARERTLKMLCGTHDIGLEVGDPRKDGSRKVALDMGRFAL